MLRSLTRQPLTLTLALIVQALICLSFGESRVQILSGLQFGEHQVPGESEDPAKPTTSERSDLGISVAGNATRRPRVVMFQVYGSEWSSKRSRFQSAYWSPLAAFAAKLQIFQDPDATRQLPLRC
jgi:hypothetical protein